MKQEPENDPKRIAGDPHEQGILTSPYDVVIAEVMEATLASKGQSWYEAATEISRRTELPFREALLAVMRYEKDGVRLFQRSSNLKLGVVISIAVLYVFVVIATIVAGWYGHYYYLPLLMLATYISILSYGRFKRRK